MATFRINKEENFVQIHKTPIMDQRLSFKAKGILMYLLSRPNDWQVYEIEIVKHSKDGRDSVRSGIKELIKNGYITRHESRDDNGRFKGYDYEVYEIPRVGKSDNGKSDIGQSYTTNNKVTNINKTKNDKRYLLTSKQDRILNYYNEAFKDHFNKDHPTLTGEQLDEVEELKDRAMLEVDIPSDDEMMELIDKHFEMLPDGNDGKIQGFLAHNGNNFGVIFRYAQT